MTRLAGKLSRHVRSNIYMKVTCPSCHALLPASQLNVVTDVAVCHHCNDAFSISSVLAQGYGVEGFDLGAPPRGAWFDDTGNGWRIGATTRSPIAFFLVPFMCVWSGFSLGGIYGSQILQGRFDLVASLLGIPFLLGTLLFGSIAVMSVCGKVVVSTDSNEGRVFIGVGPLGWRRRFDWASISAVDEALLGYHYPGSHALTISLVGQSRIKFGGMLSEARRYYLLQGLRKLRASGK
jgi:hypothetical protein